jgi:microcystin-dependent protein
MSQPYIGQIILVGFNFAPPGWAFCFGQFLPISEYEPLFALIGTTYGGDGQTTFALPDLRSRVPVHMGQGTRCRNGAGNQLTPVGNVPAIDPNPAFTDASLAAGLPPVRAVHITELRNRVDVLRASAGLQPYAWTDPVLTAGATLVRAQHLIDLRTALTQACAAGGYPAPVYAEPIAAGTTIKASHITELRNVLRLTPYSSAAPDSTMAPGTIQLGGSVTVAQAGGNQPHNNLQPYLAMNYLIALFGIFPSQS